MEVRPECSSLPRPLFAEIVRSPSRFSQIAIVSSTSPTLCACAHSVMRSQDSIFKVETLRLESNSSNEIYLEVATDALARALKSAAVWILHFSLSLERGSN